MDESILNSTKKILGISPDYTVFDPDVVTHINAAFSVLNQIGVGPSGGFLIEDADSKWSELSLPRDQLSLVKTYMFLKVKMLFDPPTTSFLLEAVKAQVEEYEVRLSYSRENRIPVNGEEVVI